jgi:prepilin-type N-terminal cleavage/methylation domain-containing protein
MARRRAFTLIELLVVIAIIAILAAILFPVFAQAKLAAKKASSLSNNKQIALAGLMYAEAYDDFLPLFMNGNYTDAVGLTNPTTHVADTWVWLTQPYIKNLQLMVDPGRGDYRNYFGSGPNAWWGNQNRYPMYGLNYVFVSPFLVPDGVNCNWAEGKSGTAADEPAATVFFVGSRVFEADKNRGFFGANAPGMWEWIAPHANYCIFYGPHPTEGANCAGDWCGASTLPRKYTASTAINYQDGGTVTFLDGHAKYLKDSAMAAGTNYTTAVPNGILNAGGAKIIDKTKYIWNLDSNYYGG